MADQQNSQFGRGEFGTILFGPTGYTITLGTTSPSVVAIVRNSTGSASGAEFNTSQFGTFEFGSIPGSGNTAVTLSVVCGSVAASSRVCARVLATFSAIPGVSIRSIHKNSGIVSVTATVANRTVSKLFGTSSTTASVVTIFRTLLRALGASEASSSILHRNVGRVQAVVGGSTGVNVRNAGKNMLATVSSGETILRALSKNFIATSLPSVESIRTVYYTFGAAAGDIATYTYLKTKTLLLSAASLPVSAISKSFSRVLGAVVNTQGIVTRALSKFMDAFSAARNGNIFVAGRIIIPSTPKERTLNVGREQRLWIDNGRVGEVGQTVPYVMPDGLSPDETLDFQIDLTRELAARNGGSSDSIVSVTWTIPTGISAVSTSNTTTRATVFLSAVNAVLGDVFVLKAVITTEQRVYERQFSVEIVQK